MNQWLLHWILQNVMDDTFSESYTKDHYVWLYHFFFIMPWKWSASLFSAPVLSGKISASVNVSNIYHFESFRTLLLTRNIHTTNFPYKTEYPIIKQFVRRIIVWKAVFAKLNTKNTVHLFNWTIFCHSAYEFQCYCLMFVTYLKSFLLPQASLIAITTSKALVDCWWIVKHSIPSCIFCHKSIWMCIAH